MRPFLYQRLFQALLLELASGYYPAGARFLSLRQIAERYDVAKPTAGLAHKELINHELLSVTARSGCYVLPEARERAMLLLGKSPLFSIPVPQSWNSKKQRLRGQSISPARVMVIFTIPSTLVLPFQGQGYLPLELRSSAGCAQVAGNNGVEVSFALHDGSEQRERSILQSLSRDELSGILIVDQRVHVVSLDSIIDVAIRRGLPVCKTGSEAYEKDIVHVDFNNVQAGYDAVYKFGSAGHREVCILLPDTGESCFRLRVEGATAAVEELGMDCEFIEVDVHDVQQSIHTALFGRHFPQAILCTTHDLAVALDSLIRRRRRKPGKDFSLITFSSIHELSKGRYTDIMKMEFDQRGAVAMQTLIDVIRGKDVHRSVMIPMEYEACVGVSTLCVGNGK